MFKLNLHCHTQYSDGDSYKKMIEKYKELGFCCAVTTDHLYTKPSNYSLSWFTFHHQLQRAKRLEKEYNINIITGVEVCTYHEEFLLFGYDTIEALFLNWKKLKSPIEVIDFLLQQKTKYATILCHPSLQTWNNHDYYEKLFTMLDGYELYNCGHNYFSMREVDDRLKDKIPFSNSDAHMVDWLTDGYNIVDQNITNENELIDWIKSKPTFDIHAKFKK